MLRIRQFLRTYGFPLAIVTTNAAYAWIIVLSCTPVDTVDYPSLVTEGLVAMLPMVGMFMSVGLQKEDSAVFHPLMTGLALLTISTSTDMIDELYNEPAFANILFEGIFQVLGFSLVLLSLHRWIKHSHSLHARLHELAHTDSLTGIANRRHFISSTEAEIARTSRHSSPLSLIAFDIDHFKQINDIYGHDTGDQVLQNICQLINPQIRSTDLLARIGGEEFMILAPHSDINEARILAEKCRLTLESNAISKIGRMTASFGVTEFNGSETVDEFLKKADRALYKAKTAGRNRVETVGI
jgi:diguanylate cyclase (GGDEF)-like protein